MRSGTVSSWRTPVICAHHVAQGFQMLHVDRGVDVDAGIEQLLDVLPALLVPRRRIAAAEVGVRQLIDQQQLRLARERGIEIEFAARAVAEFDQQRRQLLQPSRAGARSPGGRAVRRSRRPRRRPACLPPLRGLEHGVALADPGIGAKEDGQPPAPGARGRGLHMRQQLIRIGTAVVHRPHYRAHSRPDGGVSAILRREWRPGRDSASSTLTPGSPNIPHWRGRVWRRICWRTSAGSSPRAAATRRN